MSLPYYGHPKEYDTLSINELEAEYLRLVTIVNTCPIRGYTWYMWLQVLLDKWYMLKYPMQPVAVRVLSPEENKAIYEARIRAESGK